MHRLRRSPTQRSELREEAVMPKAPITPITPEIEEQLEETKRENQDGDPEESADREVPGSDEVPIKSEGGAQRQPS